MRDKMITLLYLALLLGGSFYLAVPVFKSRRILQHEIGKYYCHQLTKKEEAKIIYSYRAIVGISYPAEMKRLKYSSKCKAESQANKISSSWNWNIINIIGQGNHTILGYFGV